MKTKKTTKTIRQRTRSSSDRRTSGQLMRLIIQLGHLLDDLPAQGLRPGEALELGGDIFLLGPSLNHNVGRSLRGRPDLFPDLPFSGDEILERQERAHSWRALESLLRGGADACRENYLLEQATANRLSLRAVNAVIVAEENPDLCPHLDLRARGLCLLSALVLMEAVRDGRRSRKARGAGKKEAQAPLTPRQKQADKAGKARRHDELMTAFEGVLKKK